jgi:hypothetical protein
MDCNTRRGASPALIQIDGGHHLYHEINSGDSGGGSSSCLHLIIMRCRRFFSHFSKVPKPLHPDVEKLTTMLS